MGDEIAKIGGQMDRMEYRSHTDKLLNQINLNPVTETVGQRPYPVSRTELQSLLLNAFNNNLETVKLNAQCIGVEQNTQGVTAYFANGYQTSADLLIAADGIHSQLRDYVVGHPVKLRYADDVNWNVLIKPVSSIKSALFSLMYFCSVSFFSTSCAIFNGTGMYDT